MRNVISASGSLSGKWIVTLLLLFTISSCSKDETQSHQQDPNKTYLTKMLQIDSSASGKDTLSETIAYDNMKRVILVADSIVSGGLSTFFAKEIFYYQASDTLPYKSSLDLQDGSFIDSITRFFFYDNMGRKVKDSIISKTVNGGIRNSREIKTYEYAGNMIYGLQTFTNLDNPAQVTSKTDTATLDAAGNIVQSIETSTTHRSTFTNSYDQNPTPFSKTNILPSRDVFINVWTDYWLISPNNQVYKKGERSGSPTYEGWINYFYNSEGYPTKSVRTESDRPGGAKILEFVYSTL